MNIILEMPNGLLLKIVAESEYERIILYPIPGNGLFDHEEISDTVSKMLQSCALNIYSKVLNQGEDNEPDIINDGVID